MPHRRSVFLYRNSEICVGIQFSCLTNEKVIREFALPALLFRMRRKISKSDTGISFSRVDFSISAELFQFPYSNSQFLCSSAGREKSFGGNARVFSELDSVLPSNVDLPDPVRRAESIYLCRGYLRRLKDHHGAGDQLIVRQADMKPIRALRRGDGQGFSI